MFSEDCRSKGFAEDPEYVVIQPATRITVTGPGDEVLQVIEIPERKYTRADVDPEWLRLHDAEQQEQGK